MCLSFLVKILCYTWRPFTITLASSAFIYDGRCPIIADEKRTLLNNILRRKANWIDNILRRNCLLLDTIEGQMTEVK